LRKYPLLPDPHRSPRAYNPTMAGATEVSNISSTPRRTANHAVIVKNPGLPRVLGQRCDNRRDVGPTRAVEVRQGSTVKHLSNIQLRRNCTIPSFLRGSAWLVVEGKPCPAAALPNGLRNVAPISHDTRKQAHPEEFVESISGSIYFPLPNCSHI